MEKPFSVTLWESHPDEGNDDCSTGDEFATEVEARACIANLDKHFKGSRSTPYVMLDGPGINEVTERPGVKRAKDDNFEREWRKERAMEAGMLGGCEAYNDVMGY
jgi:hypothetical protein